MGVAPQVERSKERAHARFAKFCILPGGACYSFAMALRRDIHTPRQGDTFEPQPLYIPALNPNDPRERGLGSPPREQGRSDDARPGTKVFEIDIS